MIAVVVPHQVASMVFAHMYCFSSKTCCYLKQMAYKSFIAFMKSGVGLSKSLVLGKLVHFPLVFLAICSID